MSPPKEEAAAQAGDVRSEGPDRPDGKGPPPQEPSGQASEPGRDPEQEADQRSEQSAGPDQGPRSEQEADNLPKDEAAGMRRGSQQVLNYFYGPVSGSLVNLGITEQPSGERQTGPLDEEKIDRALGSYVEPSCFDDALELLRANRLIALAGQDGIGKYAGALALLRRVAPGAQTVGISPIASMEDLLAYEFRDGRAYVVRDREPDSGSRAQLEWQADELARRLNESRTYLVVTVTGSPQRAAALRTRAIEWQRPDLDALLERCLEELGLTVGDRERDLLLERLGTHPSPASVIALARRVRDRGGVKEALASLDSSNRAAVCDFFDRDPEPDLDMLLFTAALAFAHGLPEQVFERELAGLERCFDESLEPTQPETRVETGPEGTDGDQRAGPGPARPRWLPQTRRLRLQAGDLVDLISEDVTQPDASAVPDRLLVFRVPGYRATVIGELWERYDRKLWEPLTEWLHSIALGGTAEVRQQAALGVVLLARAAGHGMLDTFLETWSRATWSGRLACAYVMWWSCLDDALAPLALRTAVRWSKEGSPSQQATAAITLAGQLGVQYTGEALRALWRLAQRGDYVGRMARESIADLFSALAEGPGNGSRVLRFLRARGTRPNATLHQRNALATTAWLVVKANLPGSEEPTAASVLRTEPEQVGVLGWLWAEALCARPLRAASIEALRRTLKELSHQPNCEPIVRALGDAISLALPPGELALLRRELVAAFTTSRKGDEGLAKALIDALIDAFEVDGRNGPRRRAAGTPTATSSEPAGTSETARGDGDGKSD